MALELFGALVDIASGLDALVLIVAPWRYLFSRSYRVRKHREWAEKPRRAAIEQIGGVLVAVLTVTLIAFVAILIFSTHSSAP